MKRTIIAILILLTSAGSYGVITDLGIDPLDLSSGSRPLGMGEAYTAATGDVSTLFYNPAGIARSKGLTSTFSSMNNFSMGAGYETGIGNVGFGIIYKSYDNISSEETKTSYSSNTIVLGWGASFGQFSFGISLKGLLSQRLSVAGNPDLAANSLYDGDAGILWEPLEYVTIGFVSHNALDQSYTIGGTTESFPKTSRAGIDLRLIGTHSLLASDVFGIRLAYDSESGVFGDQQVLNYYYGTEISVFDTFFLRAGGELALHPRRQPDWDNGGIGIPVRIYRDQRGKLQESAYRIYHGLYFFHLFSAEIRHLRGGETGGDDADQHDKHRVACR